MVDLRASFSSALGAGYSVTGATMKYDAETGGYRLAFSFLAPDGTIEGVTDLMVPGAEPVLKAKQMAASWLAILGEKQP